MAIWTFGKKNPETVSNLKKQLHENELRVKELEETHALQQKLHEQKTKEWNLKHEKMIKFQNRLSEVASGIGSGASNLGKSAYKYGRKHKYI